MARASRPVSLALLGAGARGELNLATLARKHPNRLRITAVAEADPRRRDAFAHRFGLSPRRVFDDWQALLDRPRLADGLINALPCRLHLDAGLAALARGYHVLQEKPMALSPAGCVRLVQAAERHDRRLMIAVQSRYNEAYQRMRRRLAAGAIGRLMTVDCAENIGYWHFVMSYVRGIHHRTDLSHSFMLAKGIHDVDLVAWLVDAPVTRVSSFGRLSFFREEHAPPGAPARCTDGCPVERDCAFSALRQFVTPGRPELPWKLLTGMSLGAAWDVLRNPRLRRLSSVIAPDGAQDEAQLLALLRETDHGRCVFRAHNDVIDHQTVLMEFDNGVQASLVLNAFSLVWERTLHLHGTAGELRSADFSGRLEERQYHPARARTERVPFHGIFHGGGDERLLLAFVEGLARGAAPDATFPDARQCLESHLIGFAAEQARTTGTVVSLDAVRAQAWSEALPPVP